MGTERTAHESATPTADVEPASDSRLRSPFPLPARAVGLTVGHAEDPLEREADRRADDALARLAATGDDLHAHGPGCEHLRRSIATADQPAVGYDGGPLPSGVIRRIDRLRGSGDSLPGAVRARMEQGFGASFSDVRVHVGDEPNRLNRLVSAEAFTVGRDIFFGAGRFAPDSPTGERVLAHELAHTLQPDSRGARRSVIRRQLGSGQSGKQVKDREDRRYLAHETEPKKYSLQPLDGGPALVVDVDSPDSEQYDPVGEDVASGDEVATAVSPKERKTVAYDVLEWSGRMRGLIDIGDLGAAKLHLQRMKAIAGGLPDLGHPVLSDKDLAAKMADWPSVRALAAKYRQGLVRGTDWFEAQVLAMSLLAFGKAATNDDRAQIAQQGAQKIRDLRRTDAILPTIIRLIDEDAAALEQKIADEEQRLPPTILEQPDLKSAYLAMTREKFSKDKFGTKYDAAISDSGLDPVDGQARAILLDHLEGSLVQTAPQDDDLDKQKQERLKLAERLKSETVDQILSRHVHKKATRLAALFDAHEGLANQVTGLVKDETIHAALTAIATGNATHSIKDINDYVGDKLNDPLMDWVIRKGIDVEVHATSALASFGKLRTQGFTEVLEVPSSHAGTKKYIAGNPETGTAKVVFQTLPGASYAIQTTGAFLFYELYRDGVIKDELDVDPGPWQYDDYTARNVISAKNKIARYLLVSDGKPTMCADVPYGDRPPPIDDDGKIVLTGVAKSAIKVSTITVDRMDPEKVTVHREDVDYKKMYLDIMRTNGVNDVEIASIGQKRELKAVLKSAGLDKPTLNLELPNFNVAVYRLKKSDGQVVNLALFQISPDFFGDRAGFLTQALEDLGVKHITFVGTAGGLAARIKKGETVVPEKVAQVADVTTFEDEIAEEKRLPNAAFTDLEELRTKAGLGDEQVNPGGLHVGVHSPITESESMIAWMKAQSVRSVDCEAGFIADVLKNSEIKLYAIYYISDVPGTHESIGQGGVSSGGHDGPESSGPNPSELLVQEIIKKAVGGTIEAAEKTVSGIEPITSKGRIQVAMQDKDAFVPREIEVTVVQPSLVGGADTVGLVRTFARAVIAKTKDLDKIKNRPQVTPDVMMELNKLAREFSELHRVKLVLKLVAP